MKKGFTLIELLVVVLIIGILSAIALPQYTKAVEKARMAEALSNMSILKEAVDISSLEQGSFPSGKSLQDILEMSGVELSGGNWNYETEPPSYRTKNFSYRISCSMNMCEVVADRESTNGGYYSLAAIKYSSDNQYNTPGWSFSNCITQDTDFGRMMCKNVPGYEYQDGEY